MLAGLIGNVLDMEKIESREILLEDEPFTLTLLVETYLPSFESLSKKNNVGFSFQIDEHCHLYWRGDKLRIMQILNNVVGNAIKFSAGKTVELIAKSQQSTLCFTVRDTGCGMDKTTLDNLFKRFHKGRDNAAKGIESNGLGMAITKDLVDLMGGSISVQSEVGKGTEFVVELPLGLMQEPLKPEQAILKAIEELTEEDLNDTQDWRDSHVLLVDDAMTNLYVLEAMLSTMVKRVSIASSGDEALEVVYQDKVDILISDISMPGMNGMELLVKVRDFQPFIPAIALSGNVLQEDLKQYRKAGFDDVLTKPVQKQRLQACMEKVFMLKQAEKNGIIPATDNHTLH
jgi:CheY-like chemotaxis protein/anti-sigma regulatory factor (Ser/Thr protein kinase)